MADSMLVKVYPDDCLEHNKYAEGDARDTEEQRPRGHALLLDELRIGRPGVAPLEVVCGPPAIHREVHVDACRASNAEDDELYRD